MHGDVICRLNEGVALHISTPFLLRKGPGAFYKVTQEAHTGTGSHQGEGNLRLTEEIPAGS